MRPRRERVLAAVAAATLAGGCPPAKPTIELPAATGAVTAELVGTLDGPGGPRDPRALAVVGGTLYVGDLDGLAIYDIVDPAAPALRARVLSRPVDALAVASGRVYTIDIAGSHRLAEIDVGDPATPRLVREVESRTFTFGGVAARPGLIWHAVGSNPPSRLYRDLQASCPAPDRERGAMNVWLGERWALETVHFDDFGGDELDGNGAFGLVSFTIADSGAGCPRVAPSDVFYFDTHDQNRSRFERPSASDLQVALGPGGDTIFVTGEQRLRRVAITAGGGMTEVDVLDLPEALSVAVDSGAAGALVAVGNGDLLLVDVRPTGLALAVALTTPGITRAITFAGDGHHLYAASGDAGLAIVRYDRVTP